VTVLSQRLEEIAFRYGVWKVYAFGSRAKEAAARRHDGEMNASCHKSDVEVYLQMLIHSKEGA
jgi:hypothetical protein